MMMKLLLVTMQDNYNIGNRLQNYALTTVLEQYGAEVTNIDNGYTKIPSKREVFKNKIKKFLGVLGSKTYADKYLIFRNLSFRREANCMFTQRYMSKMLKTTFADAFKKDWKEYDLAIVGSDQVWHKWEADELELPYYYLEFLPENKRISYAASFGFEEFPAGDRDQHLKGLREMHTISCRESSGCELVKRETGRNAVQVLDPTLLLSANEWRKIAAPIPEDLHVKKGGYAFLYFLGQIPPEYQAFIDKKIAERRIKVIDFLDLKDEAIAKCGVGEFLSLIDQADYVFTDSFHCTVFSILFNKEFKVFKRKGEGFEKMYGRIEDLLQATGHTDRAYEPLTENKDAIPYEILYENSRRYLEEVLG